MILPLTEAVGNCIGALHRGGNPVQLGFAISLAIQNHDQLVSFRWSKHSSCADVFAD